MLLTDFPKPLMLQPEEIDVIEPRDRPTVSQFAAERVMSKKESPKYPGKWDNDVTPYLCEIMDCFADTVTREIWVWKCVQSGVSQAALNCLRYIIEHMPGPTSLVFPDENMTKKRLRTLIKWMFQSNPSLVKYLKNKDIRNLYTGQENDLINMCLYIAWAGSAATLGGDSILYGFLDEVAKHPDVIGSESNSIELFRDRFTIFEALYKMFAFSSPTTTDNKFKRECDNTDQRKYWVKCPFCNQRHITNHEYMNFDKNSVGHLLTPTDYLKGDCSRYICPHCEKKWTDWDRYKAVKPGIWASRDCKVDPDGKIIGKVFSNPMRGYQIPAFLLYPASMTIKRLAYEWAKAQVSLKAGDVKPLQNYINSRLGEFWIEKTKETAADKLIPHIGTYKIETIPDGVQIITIGIDVQLDHIWFIVVGWGYRSEVWNIEEGIIETGAVKQLSNWGLVEELIQKQWHYADNDKKTMAAVLTAIDCGDEQEVVFDFCMKMQKQGIPVIPVKGSGLGRFEIYSPHKVRNDKLIRYDINVNNVKNKLFRFMYETENSGPSYWHFHAETSQEIREHLSSEYLVAEKISLRKTNLVWKPKAEHKPNHLWDAAVYATAAAEIAGVHTLRDPAATRDKTTYSAEKETQTDRPIKTKY